jgi:exodeoxyribonuclease VII small subunit
MTKNPTPVEELTYEKAYAELEGIVATLEGEERTLNEAIAQYERGQALAKHCADLLDKAELKVQQLSGDEMADFES